MDSISNFGTFIPRDFLFEIFSHLSIETLAIAARVSKQFNTVSKSDDIWKPLCYKVFSRRFKVKLTINDDSSFKNIFKNNVLSLISLVNETKDILTFHGLREDGARIFSKEFLACLDSKKTSWEQVKTIRAYVNTSFYYQGNMQSRLWTACEHAFPAQEHGLQNLINMEILLMYGANPNYFHDTFYCPTALFVTASRAEKEALQLLLEFGADPQITDKHDQTAYDFVGKNPWYGATEDDKVAIRKLLENQNRLSQQLKRPREEETSLDSQEELVRERDCPKKARTEIANQEKEKNR